MNTNVFECFEEQTEHRQFAKTREALEAYVKKNLNFAEDVSSLFSDDVEEPQLEIPTELDAGAFAVEKAIRDKELREFVKKKGALKGKLATIQAVILGQCSKTMKDKLRSVDNFKAETRRNNCLWLLQQIRAISLLFDRKKNAFISILNAQRGFLKCKHHPGRLPASSPSLMAAPPPITDLSRPMTKTETIALRTSDAPGHTTGVCDRRDYGCRPFQVRGTHRPPFQSLRYAAQ